MPVNSASPSSLPSAPGGVESRRPHGLADEIGRLLVASATPEAFFAGFLERVLAAMGGCAGAVWGRAPEGDYRVRYQVNL
ncbi:MAG TPA: hypothetical protein VJ739_01780, partial [Gemmataceae bacterium]|nr:hypothetical protein [Gemmataceae bacterium]